MDGREGVAGCRSPQKVKSLQRACHTCSFSSRVPFVVHVVEKERRSTSSYQTFW